MPTNFKIETLAPGMLTVFVRLVEEVDGRYKRLKAGMAMMMMVQGRRSHVHLRRMRGVLDLDRGNCPGVSAEQKYRPVSSTFTIST